MLLVWFMMMFMGLELRSTLRDLIKKEIWEIHKPTFKPQPHKPSVVPPRPVAYAKCPICKTVLPRFTMVKVKDTRLPVLIGPLDIWLCPGCIPGTEFDRRKQDRERPEQLSEDGRYNWGFHKQPSTPEPPAPPPAEKPAFDYEAWYERMPENLTLRVLQGDTVEVKLWIAEPALYKHEPYNSEDK